MGLDGVIPLCLSALTPRMVSFSLSGMVVTDQAMASTFSKP